MAQKRSVGLVVMFDLPNGKRTLLQRRGKWNFEKNKPESYPGGCQVTVHGGLEDNEDFLSALRRETSEELGDVLDDCDWNKVQEVHRVEDEKKSVITYGLLLPAERYDDFENRRRLHKSAEEMVPLSKEDLDKILNLSDFNKETGVADTDIIAMFLDEKEAVKKAFDLLGKKTDPTN